MLIESHHSLFVLAKPAVQGLRGPILSGHQSTPFADWAYSFALCKQTPNTGCACVSEQQDLESRASRGKRSSLVAPLTRRAPIPRRRENVTQTTITRCDDTKKQRRPSPADRQKRLAFPAITRGRLLTLPSIYGLHRHESPSESEANVSCPNKNNNHAHNKKHYERSSFPHGRRKSSFGRDSEAYALPFLDMTHTPRGSRARQKCEALSPFSIFEVRMLFLCTWRALPLPFLRTPPQLVL